jgi:rhomboid protease GluP
MNNTLLYHLQCITRSFWEPGIMDVFYWGGNIRLHTLGGEGWRVITSCFLHFGIVHLVTNMIALFFIGRLLEPVLGRTVFFASYICSGALGSLLSVLVAGTRLSAGASGAIFGLFGVFLALLTTRLLSGEIKRLLFQGVFLFTAYALMDGMGEQVDNAAHIGGLASGFVFGYIIFAGYYMRKSKYLAGAGIAAVTAAVIFSCLFYFHNDTIHYERMLKKMEQLEHDALVPYTDIKTKSSSEQLRGLREESGRTGNSLYALLTAHSHSGSETTKCILWRKTCCCGTGSCGLWKMRSGSARFKMEIACRLRGTVSAS